MKNAENRWFWLWDLVPIWVPVATSVTLASILTLALNKLNKLEEAENRWSWLWALFPIWAPVAASVVFAFSLTLALNKLGE